MTRYAVLVPVVAILSGCGIAHDSPSAGASPWAKADTVPRAVCGPGSLPETALQGQVPLPDRMSGRSKEGYRCNLERVGQYQGEGASWQFAWYDDCGYYGTGNGAGQANPGVVTVDVSDPAAPVATAHLAEPAGFDPWESLKVNERRELLGGVNANSGFGGPEIGLYDISGDCAQPRLLTAAAVPGSTQVGHAGAFAPDGMTYYGSSLRTAHAIDIEDPTSPTLISELHWPVHDISISEDGNRAFLAQVGLGSGQPGPEPLPGHNGLAIFDVSAIQSRAAAPAATPVGVVFWEDGSTAQEADEVFIGGKRHIIFTDEIGSGGLGAALTGSGPQTACDKGLPPWGLVRIIDISDEANPVVVSRLLLEVNHPDNCEMTIPDVTGTGTFGYDAHYCSVDDPKNATIVACGHFQAGIRVFDIRDPAKPREIAYYNPPAQVDKADQLPGSDHAGEKSADWCSANVRIVRERGELWTTCQDNGFLVLRFTNGAWPFTE